jgi:peptidoglycan/xylan/chitin deacetylase (PgdA/CDA1 family)
MNQQRLLSAMSSILAILGLLGCGRFEREHPERSAPGTTGICLWKGNKEAAISLTFDDALWGPTQTYVSELHARGMLATFFVPTDWIDNPDAEIKDSANVGVDHGTWDDWRGVAAQGHEIASHSHTHPHLAALESEDAIREELRLSKRILERELSPHQCVTIGFPYGSSDERVRRIAAHYYIAGRAPQGINPAYPADFYDIKRLGPRTDTTLSTMTGWVEEAIAQRSWLMVTFHGIDGVAWEPLPRERFIQFLDYVQSRRDVLWVAPFASVVKYIKERNAAKIADLSVDTQEIRFHLSDDLPDDIYDESLSLITYVPQAWSQVQVMQGKDWQRLNVQRDDGATRIRYHAVPDQGHVRIKPLRYANE